MVRKEDWVDASKSEIPRDARLLAIVKSSGTNDRYSTMVVITSGVTNTFTPYPSYCYEERPLSDILWWQSMELPFGMEDDTMSWNYVWTHVPELKECPHEKFPTPDAHDKAVYGLMWRVRSPVVPTRSVDIYVRTTNHPKHSDTLFLYERYSEVDVFNGNIKRVMVDSGIDTVNSGEYMRRQLIEFLSLWDYFKDN